MAISFEESMRAAKNTVTSIVEQSKQREAVPIQDSSELVVNTANIEDLAAVYSEVAEKWTVAFEYEHYEDYCDDRMSKVNADKVISLDPGQINLSQETNSQYIPFEMPRYYDGFDLSKTNLMFYFVNKNGGAGRSRPINVSYSESKIRLGWLVDNNVTAIEGKVSFEIQAIGVNSKGNTYVWKTRPSDGLNILKSLEGNGVIEPDDSWIAGFLTQVTEQVALAQEAAQEATGAVGQIKEYAEEASAAAQEASSIIEDAKSELESTIDTAIDEKITSVLNTYYTKDESDAITNAIAADVADVRTQLENTDGLAAFNVEYDGSIMTFYNGENVMKEIAINSDPSDEWVEQYTSVVDEKIGLVQTALDELSEDVIGLPQTLATDYYTKTVSDERFASKDTAATNTQNIATLGGKITDLEEAVASVDRSPRLTYDIVYNDLDDENCGENKLVLYEMENEGKENEVKSVKRIYTLAGGGGGSSTNANVLYINYAVDEQGNKTTSYTFTLENIGDDGSNIYYDFSGVDPVGDSVSYANAVWQFRRGFSGAWTTIATETIYPKADNSFKVGNHISAAGTYQFKLIATDETGGYAAKTWTVELIDIRLESSFNDKNTYPIGPVAFDYTPYGTISKDIHFLLDNEEIKTITTSSSGIPNPVPFTIPEHAHGSYFLEAYMTGKINDVDVESNHIYKDIIFFDPESDVPVIGCAQRQFTALQYDTTNIVYTVYDPNTETPTVTLAVDGVVVSTQKIDTPTQTWQYKSSDAGMHELTITCGQTVKVLTAAIEELDIDVAPVVTGLAFDFDPTGKSNADEDRLWSDGDVSMTVSDNFDWVNGGYQLDENGDGYFCVKAGTTATINYNLFADDAKVNGKEFKVIFKSANIKKRDTSFISCMSNGIGLDMKVESANIYASNNSLYSPYCENDIIEFEFNINKNEDIPLVLTYEDGVGNRPMIYTSDASFWQTDAKPITIGSDDCDIHIYRMKAYSRSLSDSEILSNFIADARNADEMIDRYNRNQIYDENGALTPEVLAEKCPDLRIIMIDAPWFTNDKDNKVEDTTIRMIYKNGDPTLDNWTCRYAKHSGQGTSSNEYGYAGRNIDLIMDGDEVEFELGDGSLSKTITLTRTSVPTDYLNIKVNIASSENQNNAQMARRYNAYNPFIRAAKFNDPFVKDCMEFYNCVIFVKERDTDILTHREFSDCEYHYYALGNVGDSKKTDDTRVNDKNDPKECVLEITDYNVPLAEFPTGVNDGMCPIDQWKEGNPAYDYLYAEYKYKEGKFKSFGAESYEFRYEMKGITAEQRQANIDTWRDFYKFVVTSTDEEFYRRLKEYFVVDSALYYYLFTERYTMVDNRAKNSFWHYGKVYITDAEAEALGDAAGAYTIDNEQAAIQNGYRWDLSFGYDFDTSLGIDNTGKLVLTYGKEDTDYYVDGDPSSNYIYRAAESTFFCRLRDLFTSELQGMYVNREDANAWSSNGLISQWDEAQSQFPEEIWRLDIQRKYIRTFRGISVDNSIAKESNPRFLTEMLNGRKRYQRRMFERNQELYMATKYFGKTATQDQIMMRFNNPEEYVVKPDFTLYLTPYSDMYIGVKFGNVSATNFRAKAGVEYTVPYSVAADTADITLIYGASFIQAIGDLSACYVGDNDFSKASRLQRLTIGSTVDGYVNNNMKQISLGNNPLLEYLDIRNITGLSSVVDLSECGNLLELRAEGSSATGIIFANGGRVERFYIPDVTSLTMKNLSHIEDFSIAGHNNLQKLIVENTPAIDTLSVVNSAPNLNTVRLIGIDWNADSADVFNRVLTMRGVGSDGIAETTQSVMTGKASAPSVRQQLLYAYNAAWPELIISYKTLIPQYPVTFLNHDGSVIEVQYVDEGAHAVDPSTREDNRIIPTRDSSVSTDFTFAGWDMPLTNVFGDRVITAVYSESVRQYKIRYVNINGDLLEEMTGDYGTNHPYTKATPVYTAQEDGWMYHLFSHWDKSGVIDGDKTVTAIYDTFKYTAGAYDGKELKDLTPVEIYAMTKLSRLGTVNPADYINENTDNTYSFNIGNDIDFDDIESNVIVSEPITFTGANHIDTGIKLFDEDRDFVLAIDYEFLTGCANNAVLAQCFQDNVALGMSGIRLAYKTSGSNANLSWGEASQAVSSVNKREILVIRHRKGDNNLMVYNSNLDSENISIVTMSRSSGTINNETLVLGGSKSGTSFSNHAIGNINWCKLWYMDLGDEACRNLALWPHENITLEACGFNRYYLADEPSQKCMITLIATHLLDRDKAWSTKGSNAGGWAESTLNKSLNTRLYSAIPSQIRSILQKVTIVSTNGGGTTKNPVYGLSASSCYITVPACAELDIPEGYGSRDGYASEGSSIDFMYGENRIRGPLNGEPKRYWTRSPDVQYASYVMYVTDEGDITSYVGTGTAMGVLIMISF